MAGLKGRRRRRLDFFLGSAVGSVALAEPSGRLLEFRDTGGLSASAAGLTSKSVVRECDRLHPSGTDFGEIA